MNCFLILAHAVKTATNPARDSFARKKMMVYIILSRFDMLFFSSEGLFSAALFILDEIS